MKEEIDIYLVIYLLDRWIYRAAKDNAFAGKDNNIFVKFKTIEKLSTEVINLFAFSVLSADHPPLPKDFSTFKRLLTYANITRNHAPLQGIEFVREVMGRIKFLETLLGQANRNVVAVTQQLCATPLVMPLIATQGLADIDLWRTQGIWTETLAMYKEHFIELIDQPNQLQDLKALSTRNIRQLAVDMGLNLAQKFNPNTYLLSDYEKKLFARIFDGFIYFKHGTFSIAAMQRSGMMLCPELGGFAGVSERNAKYAHNKYVFGRMEFGDSIWKTRFGDEKAMFEIGILGENISISLHDQEQPFALNAAKTEGHTQIIDFGNYRLRTITGERTQQSWTQIYGNGDSETKKIKNSFVNEVFVGKNACRMGIAFSLIREIRRINLFCDKSVADRFNAHLNTILDGKDDLEFQLFVKQFFRIEIRVPAYINLIGHDVFRFDKKDKKQALLANPLQCVNVYPLDVAYCFNFYLYKKLSVCDAMMYYWWDGHKFLKSGGDILKAFLLPGSYANHQAFTPILVILNKKDSKPTAKDCVVPYLELKKYYHLIDCLFQHPTTDIYECPCGHLQWVTAANLVTIEVTLKDVVPKITLLNTLPQAPVLTACLLPGCQCATQHYWNVSIPNEDTVNDLQGKLNK